MLLTLFLTAFLINPPLSVLTQVIIHMYIMAYSSWNFSFERYVGGLYDYVSTKLMGLAETSAENRQVPGNLLSALFCYFLPGCGLVLGCSAMLQNKITAHCALSHLRS